MDNGDTLTTITPKSSREGYEGSNVSTGSQTPEDVTSPDTLDTDMAGGDTGGDDDNA
jgi:hypothetical protein